MEHPRRRTLPGAVTYLVLAIWAGRVTAAIVAGVFAGDGAYRLPLPAANAIPIAVVAIVYRVSPRFRNYMLTLDLRLVLAAQLWRVIGIAFLFALAFDQLPAGFAVPAGLGDLATGIAALAVVFALANRSLTRSPALRLHRARGGRLPRRRRHRADPRTAGPRRLAAGHLPHPHDSVLRRAPPRGRATEPPSLGRPSPL